ncbi:unnamed protein product, partial [Phaeothamnion confervicola]
HRAKHVVTTTLHATNLLRLEVEAEETGNRWMGEFSSKYVEDITHKTGSFKKFGVFVQMLCTALAGNSDSVFVDLLTYRDLVRL